MNTQKSKLPVTSLSLIVPVFNEKDSLSAVLEQALELKQTLTDKLEIIFIDDGSTDESREWIRQAAEKNPEVVDIYHASNKGIAVAVRSGLEKASGEWIAQISADLEFYPRDLVRIKPYMEGADIISFYRSSRPGYSYYRHRLSGINRWLNRILFGLNLKDVNWVKIYRQSVLKEVNVKSKSPFIESERLIRAQKRGYRIVEVEVPCHPRKSGKGRGARFKFVRQSIGDLLRYFFFR